MTLHTVSCEAIRIEHYALRAHLGQGSKGKYYRELVPTYQVSVLNERMYPDDECLHEFLFYDPKRNMPFGGLVRIFTVELPKVETLARSKPAREMTSAERWAAYFLYNADESEFARGLIEEIKREEEGIRMAVDVMHEYTADEKIYYRLLSEMKYEMDHRNRMLDAEERGEERGIQIGEERGRAEEREKAEAEKAAIEAERLAERAAAEAEKHTERAAMEAERLAAVNALRAAGVSEEIIERAYPDAGREGR
jgi:hypothetical protein